MGRKRVKYNAIPKSISLYEYEWAEIDKINSKSRSTAIRSIVARSKAFERVQDIETASLEALLTRIVDSEYLSNQLDIDLVEQLKLKRSLLRMKRNELEMLYQKAKEAE